MSAYVIDKAEQEKMENQLERADLAFTSLAALSQILFVCPSKEVDIHGVAAIIALAGSYYRAEGALPKAI